MKEQLRTGIIPAFVIRRIPAGLAVVLAGWFAGCQHSTTPATTVPAYPEDPGLIYTWAGTGEAGWDGDGHSLLESNFYWPVDITITHFDETFIVDWNNHRVREVTEDGKLRTVIGTDFVGDGPFDLSDQTPPGAVGTEVNLNHPTHLLHLHDGSLVLTAWHNHKLRLFVPSTGRVLVICGAGAGFAGDGGPAKDARLNQPCHTELGPDGSLYILDQRNQRVRRITPDGMINTVVGTGQAGFAGDGGSPLNAQINMPAGSNPPVGGSLAFDFQNRLYISDVLNHRIRRVDFQLDLIETIAGNGQEGFSGDGGPAIAASLNNPRDIVFGPDARLYVADEFNHRVRAIDLRSGIITTVAGNGTAGFSGDNGPATEASLNRPSGLEFDEEGHLYIVDTYNHRIRRVNL
jgi:DNA-binding beta-propeller fold protein YncE